MMELPVFQGISKAQLTEILEKIPFHFAQYEDGQTIFNHGDKCDCVTFLLSGSVRLITPAFAGKISISQVFEAPYTVPFFYAFGPETHQHDKLIALGHVGIMQLEKVKLLKALQCNEILLINVLNMLSTNAQRQHQIMDFCGYTDPVLRLSSWLLSLTDRAAFDTLIDATPTAWCAMLQMDETTFWRSVSVLEREKLVKVSSGMLKLLDRYALRTFINNKTTQNV